MMKHIDSFLNKTTMYKLVLYYCSFLIVVAFGLSIFHLVPFSPFALLFSTLFIVGISWLIHQIAAWAFSAPTNLESPYITALILVLLITPPATPTDRNYLWLAIWASVWAISSKFLFAIKKKHVFNPAAFGVAMTALTLNLAASWWVGTAVMLPFVIGTGWLIVRKIRRADLVWAFLGAATVATIIIAIINGHAIPTTLQFFFLNTPIFFFAFAMLTEPLTTSPTRNSRIAYGGLVGALFNPAISFGPIALTPELALLVGNVLSYALSPKQKLILKLNRIETVADQTFDFVFDTDQQAKFTAGQYCEWTLPHEKPDMRGNRRYFTLASSPTEKEVRMGVKYYPKPSSFKQELQTMKSGDVMIASQVSGDFVLPVDQSKKLVFIAGGIGVTPFRSMIKFMTDAGQKRDVVLMYSNKTEQEIAYRDVFAEAEKAYGLKTIYTLSDKAALSANWKGKIGMIDEAMIRETIPDFADRMFYLSGPHGMVVAFEALLYKIGVPRRHIKTDYFPGFA